MGGGKGGESPSASKALEAISKEYFGMVKPGLNTSLDMLMEMLTTGSVQTRQPIYGKAVEASQRAGSQAQSQTAEGLARTGLAGTPFGERTMADTAQQSAYQSSQIAPQMMNQDFWSMLQLLIPILTGTSSQVTQGLGSAGQSQAQAMASQSSALDWMQGIASLNPVSWTLGGK